MLDVQFMLRVLAASFATVGVVEAIKNFWKTERKIFYAVLMIPLSCACYVSVELLPLDNRKRTAVLSDARTRI